jgi:exodeoxyribonuclease VII large subunit
MRHHDLRRVFQGMQKDLQTISAQMPRAMRAVLLNRRARWEHAEAKLNALSPLRILERGYAVVFGPSGIPLTNSSQVSSGDELKVRLARGQIDATVVKTSQ